MQTIYIERYRILIQSKNMIKTLNKLNLSLKGFDEETPDTYLSI